MGAIGAEPVAALELGRGAADRLPVARRDYAIDAAAALAAPPLERH